MDGREPDGVRPAAIVTRAARLSGGGRYRKTRLRNGLRVVSEVMPSIRSISLGVWFGVGSRCESSDEGGLSHFIEHLVFKGTRRRNARQIAASLESIGGSLNAFTTREHTCYTARVLDEHLAEAVDILADITCHPTLTPANMNRERTVICEEIRESLDNPADHIHDLFTDAHWGGHPLGRPVMGTEELIRSVSRSNLKRFREKSYRAGSAVVAAAGSVSHDRLVRLVRQAFTFADGEGERPLPAARPDGPHICLKPEDTSQTQFCVGFPGLPYDHQDRVPLILLASYLGGGMSSVLFQKIREQRGLAYSVFSYHDFFRDAGLLGVYLGTDQAHLREAFDLILAECRRTRKRKLAGNTLDNVKAQVKGHLTLGMESTTARMHRLGAQELLVGTYHKLDDSLREIDEVSRSDLCRVAETVFDERRITIAALGPADANLFDDVG